ncbi:MAG: helix-turn-helix domain-containing protein [Candidatus Diapherotrites archaeon]|nr:helix-turn-helix domain-containing protein [Candidatus Micrarchaeota archaeon]MBU1939291.1 helix-turn-helix domain-containing protein [Candidatus Micrarchaeota archaeon]
MERELLLGKIAQALKERGFGIILFTHTNSCFDIIARGAQATLAVKAYGNIDAIRQGQAAELVKVGRVLGVNAIIVGIKAKAFTLKDGTVYERYGLPVVTVGTLKNALDEKMPGVRCFKGREVVALDAERLHGKRKALGLTLDELANRVDSTAESIHRYEKGFGASLGTAKRLEDELHEKLIRKVDLFTPAGEAEFDIEMKDEVMRKIQNLGIDLAEFRHAPFHAYSKPGEELLIGRGKNRRDVLHRAEQLGKAKGAFGHEGVVVAKEFRQGQAYGVPVVKEDELDALSKGKDLIRLIKEKKGEAEL